MLALLAFACSAPPGSLEPQPDSNPTHQPQDSDPTATSTPAEPLRPSGLQTTPAPEGVEPQLSGVELQAGLVDQLEVMIRPDFDALHTSILSLLELRSNNCPEDFEDLSDGDNTVYVFYTYGCSTPEGTSFEGNFELTISNHRDGPTLETERSLYGGDVAIRAADGRELEIAGYFGSGEYREAGYQYSYLYGGGLMWAVGLGDDPLLNGGLSGDYYAAAETAGAADQYRALYFNGALSAEGAGVTALSSSGFSLQQGCNPDGEVQLREVGGAWQTLRFHEDSCDACGTFGPVSDPSSPYCFEQDLFDDLLSWEEPPW